MRYLAIDYGLKRTGLAICDKNEIIASPLAVIETRKNLLNEISEIITSSDVDAVILGVPINMDGSKGSQADLVLKFAEKLKKILPVPLHLQDERLTTFAADQKLLPTEFSWKKKAKRIDAVAAAEILQSFLDQKKED